MELMEELVRLADRVSKTHNGKNFPRSSQIEAMQKLQNFMKRLHSVELPASASKVQPPPQDQ